MFDWIPVDIYTSLQYNVLLLVLLIIILHSFMYDIKDQQSILFFKTLGSFIVLFMILYIGQRAINGFYFGDTANYNSVYKLLQKGETVKIEKDYLFNYMMVYCSQIMNIHGFLQLCAILYVLPCYLFSRKYFKSYWFFTMFMIMTSFSFWAYGTNGVRNGLGTSLFLFALVFYDRKYIMYPLFVLSYFMHASLIIPIVAFVASGLYRKPIVYVYIWLAAIPLSLVGGGAWTSFFASLGFAEDRTSGYLVNSEDNMSQFSQTGFRWDFLLYSATAVFAGWYFIFKKKITDPFYIHLFGAYCIANAFWVLVITAAFSNRFAYLSWFLMPVIIAYPMFRYKIWDHQYKIFAGILFLYFLFTYVMNVILS